MNDADSEASPVVSHGRSVALVMAGLSLLALGVALNADRWRDADPRLDRNDEPSREIVFAADVDQEAGASGHRHKGEEGKMGRPPKRKSGLYAMKGPTVPDAARAAGIVGQLQSGSGHFLASPYDAAAGEDSDVWGGLTGSEVGAAFGVGGVALVGTGRGGGGTAAGTVVGTDPANAGERYAADIVPAKHILTAKDTTSTFSIDVDTASYANVRRHIRDGQLPPAAAVRTEELINYFSYDYASPRGEDAFAVTTEVGPAPWNTERRLVHIGVRGRTIDDSAASNRNLVFLLDVSGSMSSPDKLPLVKAGLSALTRQLRPDDHVSIVVYAGAAGVVLPPTAGADRARILEAMDTLHSGGGTNGAEGIELAYELAERHMVPGGNNRVIVATDGDFNVGISDHEQLLSLIEAKRDTGVFLSVLGVGTGNLNDATMEQLADRGNGNYSYLDSEREAQKVLVHEAGSMLDTIAKDVKIQVAFDPEQIVSHRLIGYENRMLAHRDFDDDTKDAGEIGAGHTVTALYEVVPKPGAHHDDPMMTLRLRHKAPGQRTSRKQVFEVDDAEVALANTSDAFRFSASVAGLAQRLRGAEDESGWRYQDIIALATEARGDDPYCHRAEFVGMAWRAAQLADESAGDRPDLTCVTSPPLPRQSKAVPESEPDTAHVSASVDEAPDSAEESPWAFLLEVLRLLPPLLALPLFVMAVRRPRRRR